VAALPTAAHELLCMAAVVGREAPGELLLALSARPRAETVAALEALDRARLLVESAQARYQFPHDLVREVVLAELSAVRRAGVHGRVAEALEQVPERKREGRAAELAWHWQEAGDAVRALPYALLAGDQAEAAYAHQDAEWHYQTARDLARDLGDQRQEAAALEQLGIAVRFLARFRQALAALEQALALYQATGEVEGQGRVLARIGHLHEIAGTPDAGVTRVQPLVASLATAGLSLGGQAALLITLSRLYHTLAENSGTRALYDEALSAAEQAEALAAQAQDDRLLGQARVWRGSELAIIGRWEEGVQVLEDAIRLLEARGELEALSVALDNVSNIYFEGGKYDLALTGFERALAEASRLGDLEGIARQKWRRGEVLIELGQWEQARQDLEQAATFLGEERLSWALVWTHLLLSRLELAQGQRAAAAEHLKRALVVAERSEQPHFLLWTSCTLAYQDLVEGRPEAVRARLEPFLDRPWYQAGEHAWVRHLLGWACVELGDLERAEALLAEASMSSRWAVLGVLRSKARLALRQGRGPEAEQILAEALALAQAMHTPYEEAQTLYLSGLLHLQQGETQPARERLEAALDICTKLGERLYAEQVEQALAGLER
jgi:tetratricopeptide (TPR) repeat protein